MRICSSRPLIGLVAAASLVALAACGSGSDSADPGGATSASAGTQDKPAQIAFWGWAPGYEQAVKMWNKDHPETHVTFTTTPSGTRGGYQKMLNAVKAGNAPCLAQVSYDTLPSFVVEGAVQDVTGEADAAAEQFPKSTMAQVTVADKIYGVPVDTGPVAMFYRQDVFKKFGIAVPKTWAEYKTAAEKLHRADPSYTMTAFGVDPGWYSALNQQAGAQWFSTEGDSWKVGFTDQASTKVADYWQDLIDRKLVKDEATYSPQWNKELDTGKVATVVDAVWTSGVISGAAPEAKGKWAVAPAPAWSAADKAASNDGGSSTAVMAGCKNPAQAMEFATWMSTDDKAMTTLIKEAGIYPASTPGGKLPAVSKQPAYFAGDDFWKIFKDASANLGSDWQYGPTQTQANTDLSDMMGKAGTGKTTLKDGLSALQTKTVDAMKGKGMSVSGG